MSTAFGITDHITASYVFYPASLARKGKKILILYHHAVPPSDIIKELLIKQYVIIFSLPDILGTKFA